VRHKRGSPGEIPVPPPGAPQAAEEIRRIAVTGNQDLGMENRSSSADSTDSPSPAFGRNQDQLTQRHEDTKKTGAKLRAQTSWLCVRTQVSVWQVLAAEDAGTELAGAPPSALLKSGFIRVNPCLTMSAEGAGCRVSTAKPVGANHHSPSGAPPSSGTGHGELRIDSSTAEDAEKKWLHCRKPGTAEIIGGGDRQTLFS
jgi:hypothetical protein